jgi:AraC family transcriptional regulator of adaptative response/methylated-DNA-[protein]-cysteine methyltransferase
LKPGQTSRPGGTSRFLNDDARWRAVLERDAGQDGRFYYAVSSTGVYCLPSCPSRRPRRGNVRFFENAAEAERAGFRACFRCRPLEKDRQVTLIEQLCRYIESHADEPLTLEALSNQAAVSPFHLQRTFKKLVGVTPREYADACRIRLLRGNLQAGQSVTRALFDAGFGSTSRLYERSNSSLGMTPASYGRKGRGARIRYGVADSTLGRVLLAVTGKGICSLQFGDSRRELVSALKQEFSEAELFRDEAGLRPWLNAVVRYLRDAETGLPLPVDVRATAFQWRVWKHLLTISPGTTQTYSEVAAALGGPRATRAVARACASNPVALAIPCHRVVRQDGGLGGYRWGLTRKRTLLAQERQALESKRFNR